MATHETSPAITKPPYYAALSKCDGIYGGEQHWAVLATDGRGILADIEGGLSPEAKAKAEFIVRACNAHEELVKVTERALDYIRRNGFGHDQVERIEELETALTKANGQTA